MLRMLFVLCLIVGLAANGQAQPDYTNMEIVKNEFASFHYQNVIHLADSIISADTTLSKPVIVELNRMKGISQFVLGQEYNARSSFLSILELDPLFQLDPVQNSPKIIQFFNDLKLTFLQNQILTNRVEKDTATPTNTMAQLSERTADDNLNQALWRSILVPGWGHYYMGKKKSGIYLSVGSMLLVPATVYYSLDTYNKEKDYLNETESSLINSKYDTYNKSYKIRNAFIAGYAILWLYSQFDLFSGNPIQKYFQMNLASFQNYYGSSDLGISLKFNF
jgi:hypothetical protein